MEKSDFASLTSLANRVRLDVLEMIKTAGSGHLAGSLGLADVFTYFYSQVLRHDPHQPHWQERDFFFLSAGHLCPVWYATLARQGYFSPDLLSSFRQFDSPLQGHPHRQVALGIENSAGSLGQGLSLAAGVAYSLKLEGNSRQVFVVSSDGEQQEGQVWEAYLFANHYHLDNLTIIIDCNDIQQSGQVRQIMTLDNLKSKLLAFNFAVAMTDGNDFNSLNQTWQELSPVAYPKVLLCQTTPGKGVSFMENDYHWHAGQPSASLWAEALEQLQALQEKRDA